MTDASTKDDDFDLREPDDPDCDGETFDRVIGCLVRSGLDDEQVAKAFVARRDALDLIFPVVMLAAKKLRRSETIRALGESAAKARKAGVYHNPHPSLVPKVPAAPARLTRPMPKRSHPPVSPALAAAWRPMTGKMVDIPGPNGNWARSTQVLWLEATVAQHRHRAETIRRDIDGSVRDIREHERAAADCDAAGVDTLAELIRRADGSHAA